MSAVLDWTERIRYVCDIIRWGC